MEEIILVLAAQNGICTLSGKKMSFRQYENTINSLFLF